ncbi:DUF1501 domain-containing protein [Fimbriimonas ginsengisoli]|uniref:Sulfatase n=1 Tax=Fimbriimonas ginsengisoli Gsoil 348 TaxID=661478 RepID=A0A068NWX8_FIMGI|nr:DUF1501 domain-containing protein [Fimbriimonas ginsengisoli]AIE86094.1 hypothetical protein OP10G_2726 [Fimbriimonas ginsengisoli Gsoil 348]
MDPILQLQDAINRRNFLKRSGGLGLTALFSLLGADGLASSGPTSGKRVGGLPGVPHFKAKAKRVIYLFQSGAPSQMELFDPKPGLEVKMGEDLPDSIRNGQRLTGMTSGQAKFPVAPSVYKFERHGQSGMQLSELLPHMATVADEITLINSMWTDAINHDPAVTFFQTGSQIAGRPSIGSWLTYGLGTENRDLPSYVVLTSTGTGRKDDQPLYDRLWGSGFIPTQYQGVKFRNQGDPVLFLSDPDGVDRTTRRDMLDDLMALNKMKLAKTGDPEIGTRISQYELAFRMQTSVPDLTDISKEPSSVLEMYGPEVKRPGSYAYNCLLARRLAERGVRFVQLFHMGWDQHFDLPRAIKGQTYDTDQPSAALIKDLKQRGLLDDTLIVWGGEFGRTVYSQGTLTKENYGRDHHPRCFSVWLAGAGIKKGVTYGKTDDYCYNILENPVSVHDLHATMLNILGIDHTRLTYRYQGRDFRLTDVFGELVPGIMA